MKRWMRMGLDVVLLVGIIGAGSLAVSAKSTATREQQSARRARAEFSTLQMARDQAQTLATNAAATLAECRSSLIEVLDMNAEVYDIAAGHRSDAGYVGLVGLGFQNRYEDLDPVAMRRSCGV